MNACSCGTVPPHFVANRKTADGIRVEMWHDGAITGILGRALPGIPIARPRSEAGQAKTLRAGWLFMGEVEIYDVDEAGVLYAACQWAAVRGGLPGDVRARMAETRRPGLQPIWTVTSADRTAKATERQWRLPRLRWPGLAVFDRCGGANRYEVFTVHAGDRGRPSEYATTTGFRCSTLAALAEFLHSIDANLVRS